MVEDLSSPEGQEEALKWLRAQLTAVQKGEQVIVACNVEVRILEITGEQDIARKWATTGVEAYSFTTEPTAGQVRFTKQ